MTVLAEFLSSLRVGELQSFENLTIFPLIGNRFYKLGYLLLEEALAQGLLEVREVSEAGSVNEILVIHKVSPESLRKMYAKMVESYALDALEQTSRRKKGQKELAASDVGKLLDEIASSEVKEYPSVGLGEDLRLKAPGAGRILPGAGKRGCSPGRLCRFRKRKAQRGRRIMRSQQEAKGILLKFKKTGWSGRKLHHSGETGSGQQKISTGAS